MPKFTCTNCNYVIELSEDKKLPLKCPYCSKEGSLEPVKTAQELIDEVTSMMEEYE